MEDRHKNRAAADPKQRHSGAGGLLFRLIETPVFKKG